TAGKRYRKCRAGSDHRNRSRSDVSRALADRDGCASIRSSRLRPRDLAGLGASGRYVSLPDIFCGVLQVLAAREVGIDTSISFTKAWRVVLTGVGMPRSFPRRAT